jgi:hypothetical protein
LQNLYIARKVKLLFKALLCIDLKKVFLNFSPSRNAQSDAC